ncbi:MAG: hypothetical protein QM493_08295 [Sulfurovum sp.]
MNIIILRSLKDIFSFDVILFVFNISIASLLSLTDWTWLQTLGV